MGEQPDRLARARERALLAGSHTYLEMVRAHFDVRGDVIDDEIMCMCPWHENTRTPSLQVNVSTGYFWCFGCHAKGGPGKLKKFCGLIDDDEVEFGIEDIRNRLDSLADQAGSASPQIHPIPETTLRRYAFPTDYWHSRGFTDTTIASFDLGYDPLNGFVTIPIRNRRGELLGVIKRFLDPAAEPRYRYPKGFKKSLELYASWLAEHAESDELVLVEGSVDAIACWQAGFVACAQYGSRISREQIRMIRQMGFRNIVLMYDNDKAGREATNAACGKVVHLRGNRREVIYDELTDLRREFLVRKVRWSRTGPKDPGEMTSSQIREAVAASRSLM